jgi:hypothetical protein
MVGPDVKQTRCTTCDAEHEYKHARVPRQRRKADTPAALYSQVLAGGPKRVLHEPSAPDTELEGAAAAVLPRLHEDEADEPLAPAADEPAPLEATALGQAEDSDEHQTFEDGDETVREDDDIGPVHRPLIRATLPRPEGQPPPTRPAPEFTIRQPGGRPNRFRPRHARGAGGGFFGNRSNGNMPGPPMRGGMARPGGGRPTSRPKSQGHGRKRSK